jgi:hypothetical protein
MIKDGAIGSPADLRQPANGFAPMGSLLGETFDGSFASFDRKLAVLHHASMIGYPLLVYPETSCSSSCKRDWLSFAGLLINLVALHRNSVIVICYILQSLVARII